MKTKSLSYKKFHLTKVVGNEKVPTESVFGFLISPLVQKL